MNEHIFYNHLLRTQHFAPVPNSAAEEIWTSVFLVLGLLLIVIVKTNSNAQLSKVMNAVFNAQTLSRFQREDVSPFKLYNAALSVFSVLNISFLAYKFNSVYQLVTIQESNFVIYCFFIVPIAGLFVFRYAANGVIAFVTNQRRAVAEYITSCALANQSVGLVLFPLLIMAEFSRFNPLIFIYAGIGVLAASIVFKWYRGVVISLFQQRIGLLQTFSYFCALEILPLLVLVKFIIETF